MKKTMSFIIFIAVIFPFCRQAEIPEYKNGGNTVFSIDPSRNDMAEMGVYDIKDFEVDSSGHIYILVSWAESEFIYKFDAEGNFVKSFGEKGPGPGPEEIQVGQRINVNEKDEISIYDPSNKTLMFFFRSGEFLESIQLPGEIRQADLLANGKILGNVREMEAFGVRPADCIDIAAINIIFRAVSGLNQSFSGPERAD